jgi:hypothetical protein
MMAIQQIFEGREGYANGVYLAAKSAVAAMKTAGQGLEVARVDVEFGTAFAAAVFRSRIRIVRIFRRWRFIRARSGIRGGMRADECFRHGGSHGTIPVLRRAGGQCEAGSQREGKRFHENPPKNKALPAWRRA